MSVETILLDAGGVLIWPNWTRAAETLSRQGLHIEAATLAQIDPQARRALDVPALIGTSTDHGRGQRFFEQVMESAGIRHSPARDRALAELHQYQRDSNLWEHVPAFVRPALRALRERKFHLGVVSNANGTIRKLFERLDLAQLVDHIIDSGEEGIEKPDPRLFEQALRQTGAIASKTIHVGDMYHIDVVGARAAGISPVLIDEANLHPDADCPRIRTIAELPARLG